METTGIDAIGHKIGSCRAAIGTSLQILMLAVALLALRPAWAANYPLELVMPRAAGTAPMAGSNPIPAAHRIFKAYPSIPYNIRAVAFGGAYPYEFSLANAPAGMAINARTGEINWPNPSGASATPTITVTDAEGARQSSPWTITVTTSGFAFVDAVRGTASGNGSISSPWRTLADLYAHGSSGQIIYFRQGTYTPAGLATQGGNGWERAEWPESKPTIWLEYPGETVDYNAGYQSDVVTGHFIRFYGSAADPIYVDGIDFHNFRNIGLQIVSGLADYSVYRRLTFRDMALGIEGQNAAGIMFMNNYTDPTQYAVVQDSEFYNLNNGGGLKFYSHKKVLVEDNEFRDSTDGFDLKTHVPRFEVRGNTFRNIRNRALYGNMHFGGGGAGEAASGEWRFNNINTPMATVAADVNQDSEARAVHVYRNTINGPARVREVSSEDGPFHFYENVIVNSGAGAEGSHIEFVNVTAPGRVIIRDNLVGYPSDGIIDSNGFLANAYERYIGTRGHMLGDPAVTPMPPSGVVAE
jgi:hypothetical protein